MSKFMVTLSEGREIEINCDSLSINGGILELWSTKGMVAAFAAWESVRQSKDD